MENFKSLAEFAYQNGNYQEAYQYSSKSIEIEINDPHLWLIKGISYSMLENESSNKSKEIRNLIEKSIELGIKKESLLLEIEKLRKAYEFKIKHLDEELLDKVRDYQKVSMPKDGSTLVHMLGQTINKNIVAAKQGTARYNALDLLLFMCEINPSVGNCSYTLTAITRAKKHSKENGEYLKSEGQENYLYLIGLIEEKINNFNPIKSASQQETGENSKESSSFPYAPIIFWSIVLIAIIVKCS